MKRLIALMLVSVMIVMCAPFALAEDAPIEIKWSFGLGGKLGELMLSLVDDYNNSQNKVHVTAQQYGSYGQSIQAFHADLAAGTPPECLLFQMWYMAEFEDYFTALNDRYENDADFNAGDILKGCLDCGDGVVKSNHEFFPPLRILWTVRISYSKSRAPVFSGQESEPGSEPS